MIHISHIYYLMILMSTHVTREKYRSVQRDLSGSDDSISSVTAGKTEMVWAKVQNTTAQKGQMAAITLVVDGTATAAGETASAAEAGPPPTRVSPEDEAKGAAGASLTFTGA